MSKGCICCESHAKYVHNSIEYRPRGVRKLPFSKSNSTANCGQFWETKSVRENEHLTNIHSLRPKSQECSDRCWKRTNNISGCLSNICHLHNPLLEQFRRRFDRSIRGIDFRVGWNVKSNAHQLVVVGFNGIRFWKLQLDLVSVVSRQDALWNLGKIERHHFIACSNFEFLSRFKKSHTKNRWESS